MEPEGEMLREAVQNKMNVEMKYRSWNSKRWKAEDSEAIFNVMISSR